MVEISSPIFMDDLEALVGAPPPLAYGDMYQVPYEKEIVLAVDSLLNFAKQKGYAKKVSTEGHWEVLSKVCDMWAALYPTEYQGFKRYANLQRSNLKNNLAVTREGEAIMQYQGEIPVHLHQLIKAVFPLQNVAEKKFIRKFFKRFPLMKITGDKL